MAEDSPDINVVRAHERDVRAAVNAIGEYWKQDTATTYAELAQQWRDFVDTRNKFMVLAAGIAGGVVPVLSAATLPIDLWHLKGAAGCLVVNIIYGVLSHIARRVPRRMTIALLHRLGKANMRVALANTIQREYGLQNIPGLRDVVDEWADLQAANADFEAHAKRHIWMQSVDDLVFFGLFVAGLINVLLAFA